MSEALIIKVKQVRQISRGGGVMTTPLVIHQLSEAAKITSGMSVYPPGKGAPPHLHNCDEQVTLLEGRGEVEVDGAVTALEPYDSTYVEAGKVHCFRNTGETPMRILWIYSARIVTRTFAGSDEEVEHLSDKDLMG
jgi:mannose-6-phosphate isomerase-like protein (cupin superfamily)